MPSLSESNRPTADDKENVGEVVQQLPFASDTVCIIGAPLSKGQSLAGVCLGPDALREAGLHRAIKALGWSVNDVGNLDFKFADDEGAMLKMAAAAEAAAAKAGARRPVRTVAYSDAELPRSLAIGLCCEKLHEAAFAAVSRRELVVNLGGDHSIAAATLSASLRAHPELVVVWVDAHGDINTPEMSGSKRYHGMPVAHMLGWFGKRAPGFAFLDQVPCLDERRLAFLGLRNLDEAEKVFIRNSQIAAYSTREITRHGIHACVERALARIDPSGARPIHLSFDIDGCDPEIAPGTGTRARGGLSYREAHYIVQSLAETGRLVSMDLVEINPEIDREDEFLHGDDPAIAESATKTVRLGIELVQSALGKVML